MYSDRGSATWVDFSGPRRRRHIVPLMFSIFGSGSARPPQHFRNFADSSSVWTEPRDHYVSHQVEFSHGRRGNKSVKAEPVSDVRPSRDAKRLKLVTAHFVLTQSTSKRGAQRDAYRLTRGACQRSFHQSPFVVTAALLFSSNLHVHGPHQCCANRWL